MPNKPKKSRQAKYSNHASPADPLGYLSETLSLSELTNWVRTSNSVLCESAYFNDLDRRANSGVIVYLIGEHFIPLYGNADAPKKDIETSLLSVFDYDHPLMVRKGLEWLGIGYFQTCKGRPASDVANYMHVLTTLIALHEMYCGDEYWAIPDEDVRAA